MKERTVQRRCLCLLLLVSLLVSLCGCGGRRSDGATEIRKHSGEVTDNAMVVSAAAAEPSEMQNDAAICTHSQNNQALREWVEPVRTAEEFHLYVTNTETMTGYLLGAKTTEYQNALQSVYDTANSRYGTLNAHYLTHVPEYEEVQWTRKDLTTATMRELLAAKCCEGNKIPSAGALTTMFDDAESPFREKGVTAILSNFVEPASDLNALASGIEAYFDAYENSAACVIGLWDLFNAESLRSQEEKESVKLYFTSQTRGTSEQPNYIDCYTGKVPFYIVLVGPEGDVQAFAEDLYSLLDDRAVEYASNTYTNNAFRDTRSEPLNFDLIPDQKVNKVSYDVLSSYNTGNLTCTEDGNAYFATYVGVETAGSTELPREASEEEAEAISAQAKSIRYSSQVSLRTAGYDGYSDYEPQFSLYVYDQQTQSWADAGKNATTMATVTKEVWDGEVSEYINGKYNTLNAAGLTELYLSAKLDFSDESILSRDNIYRLEIRIPLNQKNNVPRGNGDLGEMGRYNISSAEYYNYISQISTLSWGNYRWTGTLRGDRTAIADALSRTPNLSAFLNRLEQIRQKYQDNEDIIQYVDILFNLPDSQYKKR